MTKTFGKGFIKTCKFRDCKRVIELWDVYCEEHKKFIDDVKEVLQLIREEGE